MNIYISGHNVSFTTVTPPSSKACFDVLSSDIHTIASYLQPTDTAGNDTLSGDEYSLGMRSKPVMGIISENILWKS